jgi:hypothetical protein
MRAENRSAGMRRVTNSKHRVSSATEPLPSRSLASHTAESPSSFAGRSGRPREGSGRTEVLRKKASKKRPASAMRLPSEMMDEFLDRAHRATCPGLSGVASRLPTADDGSAELTILVTHVADMGHFWGAIINDGQCVRFLFLIYRF